MRRVCVHIVIASALVLHPCLVIAAGSFSKQIQCSTQSATNSTKNTCREVLAGVIHLSADEAFEFETFNVRDLDNETSADSEAPAALEGNPLKDVTVNLKIEKSPLLVAYDLVYEKTVVGGISEDVYDYTWAAASGSGVFEHADFEPERCTKKKSLKELRAQFGDAVHEAKNVLQGGKVCGCQETGWGSSRYSQVHRSTLNCNAWPAVFRPSSTVWASRHCPRLHSPTYSVYSLQSWRWDFQIKVSLEWVARPDLIARLNSSVLGQPTLRREYLLNWTSPEAYDEEFDFRFKIVFSLPQAGSLPPDLSSKYFLLIPDLPLQESPPEKIQLRHDNQEPLGAALARLPSSILRLNHLRANSLLLPVNDLDLSGKTCDKVGVSLQTWAEETRVDRQDVNATSWIASESFCAQTAGSCLRNQPNDILALDKERKERGKSAQMILLDQILPGWSLESPLLLATSTHMLEDTSKLSSFEDQHDDNIYAAVPRHLAWPTDVTHNTVLEMFLNSTEIAWMAGSARGSLEDVLMHPLDKSRLIEITGVVRNKDSFASRFTLSTSRCERMASGDGQLASDDYLEISPVSRTVGPDHAEGFTLSAERFHATDEATYLCEIRLWDAKGQRVDSQPVEITFAPRALSVVTFDNPVNSEANVTHYLIEENGGEPSMWDVMNGLRVPQMGDVLGADGHTRVSSVEWDSPGVCDCSLINAWCIATNFVECTRRIRQVAMVFILLFGIAMGALVCGPSLIQLFFALSCSFCKFSRTRWKRMAAEVKAAKRKSSLLPVCEAELSDKPSVGSMSTHTPTPCNRAVAKIETPAHTDTRAREMLWGMPPAIFFRESLLNTRGRQMLRNAGEPPSNFKIESCEADSELSENEVAARVTPRAKSAARKFRPASAAAGRVAKISVVHEDSSDPDSCSQIIVPRYMCWSPPRKHKMRQPVQPKRLRQQSMYVPRKTSYASQYVKKRTAPTLLQPHPFVAADTSSSPAPTVKRRFHQQTNSSSDGDAWARIDQQAAERTQLSRSRRMALRSAAATAQPTSISRPASRKSKQTLVAARELRMQDFLVKSGTMVRQPSVHRHAVQRQRMQNASGGEGGSSTET